MKRTKSVKKDSKQTWTPLAARMRPQTLDEYEGQQEVVGPGKALRRAIQTGKVGSLILWGPPGVGKTTLAYLIAGQMEAAVERISAVTAGVQDLRQVIARAEEWQKINKRTVLIVDEIHRFNKAQQDVLLPVVEDGLVTLIGATTENPFFEVIAALVSRAEVVRLELLRDEDILVIVQKALRDKQRGLGGKKKMNIKAARKLVQMAGGDARRALNILERAYLSVKGNTILEQTVMAAVQQAAVHYDKKGDAHYDVISAFIKSLRGSDPDAALFYLFRMLMGGEDPKFIVRRMFIFASEDVGNADPHSLMLVSAVAHALEWVGLPEAEFALAHAAVYLAAAPKSNKIYQAKEAAKVDVNKHGNSMPPGQVVNAPVEGMEKFGRGVGYKYPHDFAGGLVEQQYRPNVVQGHIYYEPGTEGFEKEVKRRVEAAREVLYPDAK